MNRFIIGPIGVFSLLAALCAAGCAVEGTRDEGTGPSEQSEESEFVVTAGDGDEVSIGGTPILKQSGRHPNSQLCPGCGPVPDPWKNGPVPDPWTSSSGGSTSGSNGSSGESSSSGGK